jgi:nicotinamide riboside kinase
MAAPRSDPLMAAVIAPVIAILGAECTGKSVLTPALAARIAAETGRRCAPVAEYLREWCDARQRTPRIDEQAAIAAEQQRRIDEAATSHDIVVADTTPLMTAVYSRFIFGDASLTAGAIAAHRRCDATLLSALDIPWQPDGVQRDGPHVREPVDALLRTLMREHGIHWSVVSGLGESRVQSALDAVTPLLARIAAPGSGLFTRLAQRDAAQPAWRWVCEKCDVPDCEHALRRVAPSPAGGRGPG